MKKSELTQELFINWWLEKYHNTNMNKAKEDHPQWKKAEEDYNDLKMNRSKYSEEEEKAIYQSISEMSREFYRTYAVTREQHDEWYNWAIEVLSKSHRMSKKLTKRSFAFDYLNCSPSVIEDIKDINSSHPSDNG